MTRRRLRSWVIAATVYWALLSAGAIYALISDIRGSKLGVSGYFAPFAALPLAWLSYCFQRRQSYLQHLRSAWSIVLNAAQDAIYWTYYNPLLSQQSKLLPSPVRPSFEGYGRVLKGLAIAIEDLRPLFKNIQEGEEEQGIFPFDGLKRIWKLAAELHPIHGDWSKADAIRREMLDTWKLVRRALLVEFDRDTPSKFMAPLPPEKIAPPVIPQFPR